MTKWNTTEKPDADITVLLRVEDAEFPIVTATYDGESWWRDDSAMYPSDIVKGWMHLHEAAAIMDGV